MSLLRPEPPSDSRTAGLVTTAAPADDDEADADTFDFDSIFVELGEFGRYQAIVYGCMCAAILLYGQVTLTYVFTAGDLNYRWVSMQYWDWSWILTQNNSTGRTDARSQLKTTMPLIISAIPRHFNPSGW